MTEQQFHEIEKIFESGEEFVKQISVEEAAVTIMRRIFSGLNAEIRGFEFELLSPEEQAKFLEKKEKAKKHLKFRYTTINSDYKCLHL